MNPTLTERLRNLLEDGKPVAIVTDTNVGPLYAESLCQSVPQLTEAPVLTVPAGRKDIESLMDLWRGLSDSGMTRGGVVVNLGGGTVTDIGGFAASTFKRGVDYINVPTTLLAMADASVGGKTGIDFNGLKNEVGAFAKPLAVLADASFLKTLPSLEILSGFAEMLKTGLIADRELYSSLLALGNPVEASAEKINPLINRTIAIKEDVTKKDPSERGLRKILNFGHTVGHAYESRTAALGSPVPHGVAIAWGLLTELILSHFERGLDSAVLYPYARMVRELYPTFPFACGNYEPLLELMTHDKKNSADGLINFTLLSQVGDAHYDVLLSAEQIRPVLDATLELLGR